jgi:hypothetical protein
MVPSYLVGQALDYVAKRGYSKKDFLPEQLEHEKELMTIGYTGSFPSKSQLSVPMQFASGKYTILVDKASYEEKQKLLAKLKN